MCLADDIPVHCICDHVFHCQVALLPPSNTAFHSYRCTVFHDWVGTKPPATPFAVLNRIPSANQFWEVKTTTRTGRNFPIEESSFFF